MMHIRLEMETRFAPKNKAIYYRRVRAVWYRTIYLELYLSWNMIDINYNFFFFWQIIIYEWNTPIVVGCDSSSYAKGNTYYSRNDDLRSSKIHVGDEQTYGWVVEALMENFVAEVGESFCVGI